MVRRRRSKQLLDDLKEMRGYWILQEEALDCSLWRIRVGRGYEPGVRHITESANSRNAECWISN